MLVGEDVRVASMGGREREVREVWHGEEEREGGGNDTGIGTLRQTPKDAQSNLPMIKKILPVSKITH